MAHVFGGGLDRAPMYLLAYRGHLRWALPTEYTRPSHWELRGDNSDRVVRQSTDGWQHFLKVSDYDYRPDFARCKFCPSWQKVEIPDDGVIGVPAEPPPSEFTHSVDQFSEVHFKPAPPMRRHSTGDVMPPQNGVERFGPPSISFGVPPSIPAPRPSKSKPPPPPTSAPKPDVSCVNQGSQLPDSVHVHEAFAGLGSADDMRTTDVPEVFPIKEKEWRVMEPHQLAYDYHSRLNRPYSVGNLLWVIRAGAELLLALGSFGLACRHAQEINFRKLGRSRLYMESKRACFPAISEEVEDIFRIGACPPFTETSSTGFDACLPNNRKKSVDIAQSLRNDAQQAKVFLVDTDQVPGAERMEPCATHTVLKRNPDRSWSSEFRTISDLRRINNSIDKRDVFPAWAPGIGDVLKRVVELKRRYPSFKVWLAKRDLSNAFKRVFAHPDCAKVFAHQFLGEDFGISTNFSIGFLALPFGFLASPAYFSLVTSTIQSAHQSQGPAQADWNGGRELYAFSLRRRCHICGKRIRKSPRRMSCELGRDCKKCSRGRLYKPGKRSAGRPTAHNPIGIGF